MLGDLLDSLIILLIGPLVWILLNNIVQADQLKADTKALIKKVTINTAIKAINPIIIIANTGIIFG